MFWFISACIHSPAARKGLWGGAIYLPFFFPPLNPNFLSGTQQYTCGRCYARSNATGLRTHTCRPYILGEPFKYFVSSTYMTQRKLVCYTFISPSTPFFFFTSETKVQKHAEQLYLCCDLVVMGFCIGIWSWWHVQNKWSKVHQWKPHRKPYRKLVDLPDSIPSKPRNSNSHALIDNKRFLGTSNFFLHSQTAVQSEQWLYHFGLALVALTIVTGGLFERTKLSAHIILVCVNVVAFILGFLLFSWNPFVQVVVFLFVYAVVVHWVWDPDGSLYCRKNINKRVNDMFLI